MPLERATRELAPRWPPAVGRAAAASASAVVTSASALSPTRERARRQVVALVFVIYLLAIFEGSIRKYVVPSLGTYVFFIRDPLLVLVYVLATRHRLWPRGSGTLSLCIGMSGFGLLLFVLQSAVFGVDNIRVLLGIYGWRAYFLYAPLAFLIGAQFQEADLRRLIRWTLWLALPIAVLVAAQYFSPQGAPINVGVAEEKELQFKGIGLNAERIRPSGPFTSTQGQGQFVSTAFAMLLAVLIAPPAFRRAPALLLGLAAGALLVCVGLGGSRGTLLSCLLNVVFAMSIGLIGRGAGTRTRALVLPAVVMLLAVVLYPILLPDGFNALMDRFVVAENVESGVGGIGGRALLGFVDFFRLVDAVPALGYGLGYGGNASITLGAVVDGIEPGKLVETDFARHMVDLGPPLGIAYLVFRFVLVGWLGAQVWRVTRQRPDPLPMMLFGFASFTLLLGQLTGHGTINFYGWFVTGLCLAAVRIAAGSAPRTGAMRTPQLTLRSMSQ